MKTRNRKPNRTILAKRRHLNSWNVLVRMRIGYGKNYFNNSAKAALDVRGIGKLQKDGKPEGWKDKRMGFPIFQFSRLPIFFVGIVFILLATEVQSQEINVAAVINPRQIQIGEKARLDLTLSGDTAITHIEAPKFNFLPAFLAVPLHSKTTPRLESNKIAVSMAWAYELIPQATGDFSLSDVRFAYQGNTYFANPGPIQVSSADTYTDVSTRSVHQVEAEVSTAEPYLNAPLTYTFRYLYTAVLPTQASPTPQLPTFPDFLVEELPPLSPQTAAHSWENVLGAGTGAPVISTANRTDCHRTCYIVAACPSRA